MTPCYIQAVGLVNALGADIQQVTQSLRHPPAHGLSRHAQPLHDGRWVMVGAVQAELPEVPSAFSAHASRNNRLLLAALAQIREALEGWRARVGNERIAIVLGTSTSGIDEGTRALGATAPDHYHYTQQELGSPAMFLAAYLGVTGPAYTLSTACSSSARAFISGQRLLAADLADVVLIGGADSLCGLTLNGFYSLESLSANICSPFAAGRDGINIGEAAALCLLTREPGPVVLLGAGESSDAHHVSAPHPEGVGAEVAMGMALQQAGMTPEQVGYINLHGTGTRLNDAMEAKAVHRLFGDRVPCSSTKPLTGHTLGAAGATEAALAYLLLTEELPLPEQSFALYPRDESLAPIWLVSGRDSLQRPVVLSNSFAFGGNNVSLLLARRG
jgi:3-oxoacyl-[acyl-carrier-protein] synthase I